MTDAMNIRSFMKLMERSAEDYQGPSGNPDISYSAQDTKGEISKVVATLKNVQSGRYTKLGRNLLRIEELEKDIKVLKEETKGEARELVADLFHAEDAACTRVVDTVSFVFQMTKDPKATETVKYAKVLEELQGHLTPELIQIMEGLVEKHKSAPVQKAAALKATDKAAVTQEGINEGIGDQLKGFFGKMLKSIQQWAKGYDAKLNALKAEVGLHEGLEEADEFNEGLGYVITKEDIMVLEEAKALLEYPGMNVRIPVSQSSKSFEELGELINKLSNMVGDQK